MFVDWKSVQNGYSPNKQKLNILSQLFAKKIHAEYTTDLIGMLEVRSTDAHKCKNYHQSSNTSSLCNFVKLTVDESIISGIF